MNYISRINYSNRAFPIIKSSIYELKETDNYLLQRILNKANSKLSFLDLSTNRNISSEKCFVYHKNAVENEIDQKFEKADFFWTEYISAVGKLSDKDYNKLADEGNHRTEEIKDIIFNELFIDTFCAFYNGYLKSDPQKLNLKNRAFKHLEYLTTLLSFSGYDRDHQYALLKPALGTQIFLCKDSKDYKKLISICYHILYNYSFDFEIQCELIKGYFSNTFSNIDDKTPNQTVINKLRTGIANLENFLKNCPFNLYTYINLSDLYNLLAVRLANSQQTSEAILAIYKAVTYNIYNKQAIENEIKISEMMVNLQKQMKELKARMAYNTRLTPEGAFMMKQSQTGFSLLDSFKNSEEEKFILENFKIADHKTLWMEIGLSIPDENWETSSGELYTAISSIIKSAPQDENSIIKSWEKISGDRPCLLTLEKKTVLKFLYRRILNTDDKEKDKNNIQTDIKDIPIITSSTKNSLSKNIPLKFWLSSKQDIRLKIQSLAAVILMITVLSIFISIKVNGFIRDQAFENIESATQQNDHTKVLENSEKFLTHISWGIKDFRTEQVLQRYQSAFLKWFLNKDNSISEQDMEHINNYKNLNK